MLTVSEMRRRKSIIRVTVREHYEPMTDDEFYFYMRVGRLNSVTRRKSETIHHNMLMNVGHNMLRDAFSGSVSNIVCKFLAWGTNNTANAATMTALGAEAGRRGVTHFTPGGVGVQLITTYMSPNDAAGIGIQELGWFHGAGATATPGSGIMNSRILYARSKTNLESIQVDRTETFA